MTQGNGHGGGLEAALLAVRRMRNPARQVAAATLLLDRLAALQAEVSAVRDVALRRMREAGDSYGEIAVVSGLTRARVAQLARRTEPESADPAAAQAGSDG